MICDLNQKDGVHYGDGIPIKNGTLTGVVFFKFIWFIFQKKQCIWRHVGAFAFFDQMKNICNWLKSQESGPKKITTVLLILTLMVTGERG